MQKKNVRKLSAVEAPTGAPAAPVSAQPDFSLSEGEAELLTRARGNFDGILRQVAELDLGLAVAQQRLDEARKVAFAANDEFSKTLMMLLSGKGIPQSEFGNWEVDLPHRKVRLRAAPAPAPAPVPAPAPAPEPAGKEV